MLRRLVHRLVRFLAFAIEAALPMHARPPESVRRLPRRLGQAFGADPSLGAAALRSGPAESVKVVQRRHWNVI